MARLGAQVVGVDAAERNIPVAQAHAKQSNLKKQNRHGTPETKLADAERNDLILNQSLNSFL